MKYAVIINLPQGAEFRELPEDYFGKGVTRAIGPCASCFTPFLYNPHTVLCLRIDLETFQPTTEVEGSEMCPLCNGCIGIANRHRTAMGVELFPTSEDSTR